MVAASVTSSFHSGDVSNIIKVVCKVSGGVSNIIKVIFDNGGDVSNIVKVSDLVSGGARH